MKIKIVVDFGKMHHVYEEYWDEKPFLHAIGKRVSHICQKGFWWKSNYETDEMTTKKRIVGLEITKIINVSDEEVIEFRMKLRKLFKRDVSKK